MLACSWGGTYHPFNVCADGAHHGHLGRCSLVKIRSISECSGFWQHALLCTLITLMGTVKQSRSLWRSKDKLRSRVPVDYVKKIAVYKDKLAVQLSSKVVIYELANPDDPFDMHYQSATKIQQKLDCNLLVVTSSCVILCQ
eukprot:scaffold273013_cov17-Tisochrysis_lutea.AAC.1